MATIFFSYSHVDEALRDQLEKHLSALKHQGLITAWHDRRIVVGSVFDEEISANLETAEVILLLVSSDFLASDYCYKREVKRAMERHKAGDATVVPVILRPCDWHDTPFGKIQAAPRDGLPVTLWPNIDQAFLDVAKSIKQWLQKYGVKNAATPQMMRVGSAAETTAIGPRSSNLRVRKEFSQRDKDQFVQEGFDYSARFFENSLHELEARNPEVACKFRRIDANRFTAVAYRSGQKACQCSVFIGAVFGNGIGYSNDDGAQTNSFNESLLVEEDDHALYFKGMGLHSHTSRDGQRFGFEGAAEHLWGIFIRPLQRR